MLHEETLKKEKRRWRILQPVQTGHKPYKMWQRKTRSSIRTRSQVQRFIAFKARGCKTGEELSCTLLTSVFCGPRKLWKARLRIAWGSANTQISTSVEGLFLRPYTAGFIVCAGADVKMKAVVVKGMKWTTRSSFWMFRSCLFALSCIFVIILAEQLVNYVMQIKVRIALWPSHRW
jgi:hypothetical protein